MKKLHFKKRLQTFWPLLVSFLIPVILMTGYFASRHMAPFGNSSIMTVDLGQQYVDFFAYFHHAILSDPSSIFYTFSKALGGATIGTWSYYLMSPLNLLLLLFPIRLIPSGILIMTVIKYGLGGAAFSYLLSKTVKCNNSLNIMWSVAYAMNGWIVANQLNIMWLDSMFWLPLVVLGVQRIMHGQKAKIYLVALSASLIVNYYMGYMITLFTAIYILFELCTTKLNKKQFWNRVMRFGAQTLASFGISAFIILPTWFALSLGKAQMTRFNFKFQFDYPPMHMLVKFIMGCFSFSQIPKGSPNVFVGSVTIICVMVYLFSRSINLRKRLGALGVTFFLILSMCYQPLNLLWHAGQFPVWYPYRFSYIFCFWLIWLAAHAYRYHAHLTWLRSTLIGVFVALCWFYVYCRLPVTSFLTSQHIWAAAVYLSAAFASLALVKHHENYLTYFLMIITIIEMAFNASLSLNRISYVSNPSYVKSTALMSKSTKPIIDKGPSRIGETFFRSRDDSFSNHFASGDTFDSSLDSATCHFLEHIGQPETPRYTTYADGTLVSDRFLDYRYFLTSNSFPYTHLLTRRPDIHNYPLVRHAHQVSTYKNSTAMPMAFTTYSSAFHIKRCYDPLNYQNHVYEDLTHRGKQFHHVQVHIPYPKNLMFIGKMPKLKKVSRPETTKFTIHPRLGHVYYYVINAMLAHKVTRIRVNGRNTLPGSNYSHQIILTLNNGKSTAPLHVKIKTMVPCKINRKTRVYQMNMQKFLGTPYNAHTKITKFSSDDIRGVTHNTGHRSVIGTSIPDTPGWHLKINGRPARIYPIANEFVGAKVKPGQHHFKLTYQQPLLKNGTIVSVISILISIATGTALWLIHRKKN